MSKLDRAGLPDLERAVSVPGYDLGAVQPGIAHIGVGGFHRAHQAVYVDRLLDQGTAADWGIVGIGLMPGDAAMRTPCATRTSCTPSWSSTRTAPGRHGS